MPKSPINAPVDRSVLNKEGFLTIRKKLSTEVQTVFTAHDTYIGVIGNEADLTVNGALAVTKGATGVYRFPDGTCSIREGENTSVILNTDGSVTIDTVEGRDISEILAIANDVESRMNSVESEFDTVKTGFEEYTDTVDTIQSQFTGVLANFNILNSNVSTYDTRLTTAESSVSNVLAAEAAQNAQLANFQTTLNNEITARITQGVNFLADVTRLDGKIAQETAARTQLSSSIATSIGGLSSSINTLSSSLAARTTRLEFASSSFVSSINTLSASMVDERLSRELLATEFTSSFLSLESRLNQEIIDREFAISQLSGSVSSSDVLLFNGIMSLSNSLTSNLGLITNRLSSMSGTIAQDINWLRSNISPVADLSGIQNSLSSLTNTVSTLSQSFAFDVNLLETQIATKANSSYITELSASISLDINSLRLEGRGTSSTSTSGVFTFNEVPQGSIDGTNLQFTLANTPNPATSLMLFYNGQLMKVGTDFDYVLNGNIVTFLGKKAPEPDDMLLATYFYRVETKSYKFNEEISFTTNGSTSHAVLEHIPDPPNSLMLFLNGQLLRQGGDYTLSGKDVSTGIPPDIDDVFLATYSHS